MIKSEIEKSPMMLSGAQLAYMGDSVYELIVRAYIIKNFDYSVNEMHKTAVCFVNAQFQSKIVKEMKDFFTEEEFVIIKRGRNSKVTSQPKNMNLMDYKYATGFEALIGFLYIKEEYVRINEIFAQILNLYKGEI